MEIAALIIAIVAIVLVHRRHEELKHRIRLLEEDVAKLVEKANDQTGHHFTSVPYGLWHSG